MPLQRHRYPTDWEAISLRIRERDGWRCKWCGVPNGTVVQGTKRLYKIVLTVAHLGTTHEDGRVGNKHDKLDVRDENLAALCQRCHLGYDRKEHIERAKLNRQQLQWLRIQLFLRLRIEDN